MNIPTGYAQVNMIFEGSSLPNGAQIVFGVKPDLGVVSDPSAVSNRVTSAWNISGIEAQLANTQSCNNVLVKFGPNATGPSGLFGGPGAGTAATVGVTPNTSILVGKNTASGGRAGRGRMYIPGLPESNVDAAGVITPATRAALQTAMTAFLTDLSSNSCPMVLLHDEDTTIITDPLLVTSLSVSSRVATQRRRLRR